MKPPPYFKGTPLADVTVPIAERIPEAVLDEVRKNGGGLRLKLRLTPQTVLVAWEIERRPGYVPGNNIHYRPYFLIPGGDFQDERPVYYYQAEDGKVKWFDRDLLDGRVPVPPELAAKGYFLKRGNYTPNALYQLRQQGWYIDLETGKKIVTDF